MRVFVVTNIALKLQIIIYTLEICDPQLKLPFLNEARKGMNPEK